MRYQKVNIESVERKITSVEIGGFFFTHQVFPMSSQMRVLKIKIMVFKSRPPSLPDCRYLGVWDEEEMLGKILQSNNLGMVSFG